MLVYYRCAGGGYSNSEFLGGGLISKAVLYYGMPFFLSFVVYALRYMSWAIKRLIFHLNVWNDKQ